jgi:hypothetical protein
VFFDSLEDQRRVGGQIVAVCTAALALTIVILWLVLHTSGAPALAAALIAPAAAIICRRPGRTMRMALWASPSWPRSLCSSAP